MKLFYSTRSPYVRKCHVVALEKGLMDRMELVTVNSLDSPPELLAANPLSKVPALVTDAGDYLCESPVICEYLDHLGGGELLIPRNSDRWGVLNRAALADGILDAAVGCVVESRKPEEQRSPMWLLRYESAIRRTLAVLVKNLPVADAPLTIASVNLGVALGYLDFRLPHLGWRTDHPTLAGWYAIFSQRPSMQATIPKE